MKFSFSLPKLYAMLIKYIFIYKSELIMFEIWKKKISDQWRIISVIFNFYEVNKIPELAKVDPVLLMFGLNSCLFSETPVWLEVPLSPL